MIEKLKKILWKVDGMEFNDNLRFEWCFSVKIWKAGNRCIVVGD